ncbi:MAG: FG-GAP repeat-containing [Planctomycetota bacterium]|nr:MAG: FG-GAP repeat-containing [Planctomycetota bacterium]
MKTAIRDLSIVAIAALVIACGLYYRHAATVRESPAATEALPVASVWLEQVAEEVERIDRNAVLQGPTGTPALRRVKLANRGAGLRASADAGGVEFCGREDGWMVRMVLEAPAVTGVQADGPTAKMERGTIEERIENRRDGLEHSFLVRRGDPSLRLAVETQGIDGICEDGENRITFAAAGGGSVLEYAGLLVTDATGRPLEARMSWREGMIAIDVLEPGLYPILVDPLARSPGWQFDGLVRATWMGAQVASAGDVNGDGYGDVLVTGPQDWYQQHPGRVFVFFGSRHGLSSSPGWEASGPVNLAQLGYSAACAGDVNGDGYADIIAGAPGYSNAGSSSTGGVVGYVPGGPGPAETETKEGAAFVWYGSASGLPATPSWSVEGNWGNANLGASVAGAGDVNRDGYDDVIIGSPGWRPDSLSRTHGRAYVFAGSAVGLTTSPLRTWTGDQNRLGNVVAAAGDINRDGFDDVLIAAPLEVTETAITNNGRVYLFTGSASGPSPAPSWQVMGGLDANLGGAMAGAGDLNGDGYDDVVLCADRKDPAAYVFQGSLAGFPPAGVRVETGKVQAVGAAGDVNGDGYRDVIFGDRFYSQAPGYFQGRAWILPGGPSGLSTVSIWSATGSGSNDLFGYSVAGAGDVNRDGRSDVIVGAPGVTTTVLLGSPGSPITTRAGRAYFYYGFRRGDLNSDGRIDYSDLLNLSSFLFGPGYTPLVKESADVNGDGGYDVSDFFLLNSHLTYGTPLP